MQRLPRQRTSAAEELEVIAPSKLAIENVSKNFKGASGAVLALDQVSLNVAEGEFVCLAGAPGAKTTCSISSPASKNRIATRTGRWQADNRSWPRAARHVSGTGFVPVAERFGNVLFGLKLKPNLTNQDRQDVTKYYLELVGQSFRVCEHSRTFRWNEAARLARSRTGADPRMLLMDEPFAALDALICEQLYGDLQRPGNGFNRSSCLRADVRGDFFGRYPVIVFGAFVASKGSWTLPERDIDSVADLGRPPNTQKP